jgi:hypothetical protein
MNEEITIKVDPIDKIKEGVVVHRGDTLVVRVSPDVEWSELEEVKRLIEERLPDGAGVMVIGCEQLAVVRGGDDG